MLGPGLAIATFAAVACGAPPPTAPPTNRATAAATTKTVKLPPYGDLTVEDGALKLMDHNNGDGRVHVMTVSRDFHGSKLSWADRPGPRTDVNTGTFPISAEERDQLRSW